MNRRAVGTTVVVLGLLVAVNPLYLGLWSDTGRLSATPVTAEAADATENATVLQYDELSPHARLVVGRTIEKGRYTVLGPSNRPDAFVYPAGLDSRPGEYVVERDGRYYHLRTDGDVFGGVYLVVQFALCGLGATVAYAGHAVRRGDRSATGPAVATLVTASLSALGPPLGFPALSVVRWSFAVVGFAGLVVVGGVAKAVHRAMTHG